ncbi:MAG: hypothetical protein WA441_10380 [Methyloceanibacter sp.]
MAPKPGISPPHATSLLLLEHKDHEPSNQGRQASTSGIYVFKDAEIVDCAAPYGVFSELDAFLIADAMRPMQTRAGFAVLHNYSFLDRPDMDAFLIPGFGTRQ